MPDPIFENARLVEIYDAFDGQRFDLDHYVAITEELNAQSVLDVGCGTGCFAHMLAVKGLDVIGVDPAQASLDVARKKPNGNQIQWILGDPTCIAALAVDMAVMTGNVAQVFLTEDSWIDALTGIRKALKPTGHIVFEVRDPSQQAWLKWTREQTYQRIEIPNIGFVEGWCDVTNISKGLVSFRWTYVFEADGQILTSDSTLRFREKQEIIDSLKKTGYVIRDIRDAPDRPKMEWVFVASAS
jgi:SAM-dependent methyltransferase